MAVSTLNKTRTCGLVAFDFVAIFLGIHDLKWFAGPSAKADSDGLLFLLAVQKKMLFEKVISSNRRAQKGKSQPYTAFSYSYLRPIHSEAS